ncbi:3-hexulose-6-phosphate synthase [Alkalibacillus salilacus]|uniref:3-hexulose-6-phosphate synthase n=1 Tax=Alkalibacillus salilacus TaxID=284582 RepID=A0ABT9VHM4_9BACI|nr:3-hexulose-6-phosphate synthase [Alkalibacillus salilacus]MDQ0160466.1 3-hexulose-6-phosphate synthase [Alkalibacillus salilacus]
MKLQLALDRLTWDECFNVVGQTQDSIDIIEIGTGVIKEYGMPIVREMRKQYPDHTILSDMKICDAGGHEAKQAFSSGSDVTTVMAFSSHLTIQDCLEVAREYDGRMMIDLLEVNERSTIQKLADLDVDLVSLHIGKDKQTENGFSSNLFDLLEGYSFEVAVAGGINEQTIDDVVSHHPDIIIVGSAITKADNPAEVAKRFKEKLVS